MYTNFYPEVNDVKMWCINDYICVTYWNLIAFFLLWEVITSEVNVTAYFTNIMLHNARCGLLVGSHLQVFGCLLLTEFLLLFSGEGWDQNRDRPNTTRLVR
jgi:hypothetical protein